MAGKERYPSWVRYSGVGLELVGAVAVFTLVGYWFDQHFGWTPWGMLTGLVLGFIGGMYNLVKEAQQAEREAKTEDDIRRSGGSQSP